MHNNITVLAYELAVEAMGALRLLKGFESKLDQINHKLEDLNMDINEMKAALEQTKADQTATNAALTEGFTEVTGKLGELQTAIDELLANPGLTIPDDAAALVTEIQVLAAETKVKAQALADIVPNPAPVDPNAPVA